MKEKTYKQSALELKGFDDKQGIVEFYFASFNTLDSDGDVIAEGAYKKTLEETKENTHKSRIKHMKNHNPEQVVGVIKEFYTDDKGVIAVSQIVKTQLGKDTLIEYEAGIITEHSQGFQIMQEEKDNMEGVNIIKEIKLWEVSSLTHWGANKNTPVVGVKSEKDILSLMTKMNQILSSSNISDERGEELLKAYDILGETLKSLTKPSSDTLKAEQEEQEVIDMLGKLYIKN
jgi:HK97 family phage prohead protease